MSDLEDVTRKLAEVQDRLLALSDEAFAERYELLKERDRLRDMAAEFRVDFDAERSSDDLLAELASLRSRLAAAERQRIDIVQQSGGGTEGSAAGADGWGGVQLNQQIDAANALGNVQARIGRIKGILIDRGIEVPEP
jgi:hypothetical protein